MRVDIFQVVSPHELLRRNLCAKIVERLTYQHGTRLVDHAGASESRGVSLAHLDIVWSQPAVLRNRRGETFEECVSCSLNASLPGLGHGTLSRTSRDCFLA